MAARFVMEVDATYEGAFAACGKHFAYLSPDEETATALYQEASKWYVARERSGVVDHDDYGEYDIDPTVKRLTADSVGSLSEPRGIYDDAFDILLCEGRVAGFIVYTGKDTDRYGFQNPAPIYAKADYDIPPHFFRPDPREVVIDFSILYVDGRTLGKCKKSFSIWDDRQNKYYHDAFTLEKA
jgi:hypothetical protein